MDNSNVNDLFRKIVELASIEVGPQGSEALESTGWDCSKEIREKAKEILGILKAPLHTSEVVEMSSTGVSDCFVVIKNMAQQVLAESGDGTVNSAMNCRKIIAATRRLEELLKPSLSTGVVSGIDPDSAVVDPLVRAESDAFTQQTGASHPGCSEQSDRVEAESSNLDEIVSGEQGAKSPMCFFVVSYVQKEQIGMSVFAPWTRTSIFSLGGPRWYHFDCTFLIAPDRDVRAGD